MAFPTILQVIPALDAGGAERTTLEVAEAIVAAGGRALVASTGGRLVAELEAFGGELIEIDAATKNPVTLVTNAGKLAAIIRNEEVALVHARSRAPAWSTRWAAQRTDTPFVTTYHGTYSAKSALKRRYNQVMASGVRVIANSKYVADLIQSEYGTDPGRIVTIPRGVDIDRFNASAVSTARTNELLTNWGMFPVKEDQIVLLLPGRLTEWKGQSVAIEAVSRLDEDLRGRVLLVLAGDAQGRDDYVERLQTQAAELGLQQAVKFVGHCSDMPAALATAEIVLAPSTRTEAFGRVAAEALAMACPTIVSDHGGQREIVEQGASGLRVPPGDPAALADAITRLLRLPQAERDAMGMAGAAFVRQRYTKTALQSATLNVYKDVLQLRTGDPA